MPAESRAQIDAATLAQPVDGGFAVTVESDTEIVSERTVTQDSPHATEAEPADAASTVWFVAAGGTKQGRTLEYIVFNPGPTAAAVQVFYQSSVAPPMARSYPIDAGSRIVIDAGADAAAADADITAGISSDVPVVVAANERSASGDWIRGSLASATPGYLQYLAAGRSGPYETTTIDVMNPTAASADLTFTYVLAAGGIVQKVHTVGPFASLSVNPAAEDSLLVDAAYGLIGSAATPFAMTGSSFWPGSSVDWYEAGATVAARAAGARWAIAGAEVGGASNSETEISVTNASLRDGSLHIRLVFDDGTTAQKDFALPAISQLTIAVAAHFPEAVWKRFSALIEATAASGAAPDIVVEHAVFTSPGSVTRAGGPRVMATRIPE
jgi:hypothetical protein